MDELIRDLDEELLRKNRHNRELFDALTERQIELGISHEGRPICPFLRPYFLGQRRYESIRSAAGILSSALERIATAALLEPEIANELGLSEEELRWARLDPGYTRASVNSRLDTFLSPTGFKFLEYNGENPAGIGDQPALAIVVSARPGGQQLS
jgi:hypothetical protein